MFLITAEEGGVRAKGSPGGNGPPIGIHIPTPHRWVRVTKDGDHGPCVRWKHGKKWSL